MMKTIIFSVLATSSLLLASCGSSKGYSDLFAPEETTLNLVKVTDESNNVVLGQTTILSFNKSNFAKSRLGGNLKSGIMWSIPNCLAVSPDGNKIAYITLQNKQANVMVRSANVQGVSTQRTFRNVTDFSWSPDNRLCFSDDNSTSSTITNYICSVHGESGSMMSQHTNGSVNDINPVCSADGSIIYFCRLDNNGGPMIWSLNKNDGTLTSCARGFNPCVDPFNPNAFYCVRNNTNGRSEIWYVNYLKGIENLIVTDENRSFTNPQLSPDGKWLVMVGNSKSSVTKKNNLDIYAVRTNGTSLTQLTYHPSDDVNPIWSKDGRSIFFISSRANKDKKNNVWRMNFNLE